MLQGVPPHASSACSPPCTARACGRPAGNVQGRVAQRHVPAGDGKHGDGATSGAPPACCRTRCRPTLAPWALPYTLRSPARPNRAARPHQPRINLKQTTRGSLPARRPQPALGGAEAGKAGGAAGGPDVSPRCHNALVVCASTCGRHAMPPRQDTEPGYLHAISPGRRVGHETSRRREQRCYRPSTQHSLPALARSSSTRPRHDAPESMAAHAGVS